MGGAGIPTDRRSLPIRLDSDYFGEGTTLSFEDDLGLPDNESVPSLSFEWQAGRRRGLGVRWQDVNRDSMTQVLEEIEWGGEIISVEAEISLGFDIRTLAGGYITTKRWGFGAALNYS